MKSKAINYNKKPIEIHISTYDILTALFVFISLIVMSAMRIEIFYQIILAHWVLDFCLQPDYIAKNKSKSNILLFAHVAIYTTGLTYFGFLYAILNGTLHFIIDYFTSRLTSLLYRKGDSHNFFVVIGFDQMLHIMILYYTAPLIHNIL